MHRIPLEHLLDLPNEFWVGPMLWAAWIQDVATIRVRSGADAKMRGAPLFGS